MSNSIVLEKISVFVIRRRKILIREEGFRTGNSGLRYLFIILLVRFILKLYIYRVFLCFYLENEYFRLVVFVVRKKN